MLTLQGLGRRLGPGLVQGDAASIWVFCQCCAPLGGGPPCSAGMQPLRGASTAQYCMVPADSALQCPQQQHWLAPAPPSAARRARQPALRGTGATQRQPAPDAAAPGGAAQRQRRLPPAQHQRRPGAMKTYQPVLVPARCQSGAASRPR